MGIIVNERYFVCVLFIGSFCLQYHVVWSCQRASVRFGDGGKSVQHKIDELSYFPDTVTFFENYVRPSKPVKMTGAATSFPAFSLWATDEYLLKIAANEEELVNLETVKKEIRNQEVDRMNFTSFLNIYNHTEHYLVDKVPSFLINDVILPGPLQCSEIYENFIVDTVMWFSSGDTKSVVHTDSAENINCLIAGSKTLVLVNPHLYSKKVTIDHPEGAYSGIDVDDVDFDKYPGLKDVEYQIVNITAGDCLYIPFKWIHQVRSYGRNIAVNVWWDHGKSLDMDLSVCAGVQYNTSLTMEGIPLQGFGGQDGFDLHKLRQLLEHAVKHRSLRFPHFHALLRTELEIPPEDVVGQGYVSVLQEAFDVLDINKDGVVSPKELDDEHVSWQKVDELFGQLNVVLDVAVDKYESEHEQDEEEGEDGSRSEL